MSTQDLRLRLAVRRHGVPEVKLVWPCARTPGTTIANLLTQINEVVPLESSNWGLEDYAVELSDDQGRSYECLHFQLVSQILKDEDQVIIRSLLTDDIRRRRLSGRHQISTDGKHLVDGLAFGRPWMRTPRDRPSFELPPRKKARIEYQEMAEPDPEQLLLEGPPGPVAASEASVQSMADDDNQYFNAKEAEDDEFEPDAATEQSISEDSEDEVDVDYSPGELDKELQLLGEDEDRRNNQLTTSENSLEQLGALRVAFPLLSFSTIENELLRQKQNMRSTYNALRRSTAPSLSFDDMMDRMVTGLLEQNKYSPVQPVAPSFFGQPQPASKPLIEEIDSEISETSTSGSSDNDTSRDHLSDSGENESDEKNSSCVAGDSDSPDESSDKDTEESSDDSSSDSDESQSGFQSHRETKPIQQTSKCTSALPKSEETAPYGGLSRTQKRNARRKRAKLLNGQDSTSTSALEDAEFLARKEALLVTLSETLPEAANKTQTLGNPHQISPARNDTSERRTRVDMGAGRRMLFGALGLKNPKSRADEERIKESLMKDIKPLNNAKISEVDNGRIIQEPVEDDVNPDAWKTKITYRAVECCHEGMLLSEPPFPFVQRWDPQQQYGSMRKRKRESEAYYDDSHVEKGPSMSGKAAELSDKESDAKTRGSTTRGRDPFGNRVNGMKRAGGESQEAPDNGSNGFDDKTDLPALPEDLNSLATLEKGAAKEGMMITWKQCIMSKATQWQPVIASITGEVLPGGTETSLEVRLALRDRERKEKIYDERGQRVYDKFEVPDFEEDEEEPDDGRRVVSWDEMIEPKIMQAVSPGTNGTKEDH
ncbi:hypothetical protein NOR_08367 [Metarhizium rileyi]|uniref:DUF7357 domain-containing protein n=1 Tax=Metarhizium rileyi (strain RCEF 4871) TaxID=1649241 RepID=A0A166WDG7_METRR|nr:hypothetical protein NOR_08367 [Metarhizium rileyi RCEF 4871]